MSLSINQFLWNCHDKQGQAFWGQPHRSLLRCLGSGWFAVVSRSSLGWWFGLERAAGGLQRAELLSHMLFVSVLGMLLGSGHWHMFVHVCAPGPSPKCNGGWPPKFRRAFVALFVSGCWLGISPICAFGSLWVWVSAGVPSAFTFRNHPCYHGVNARSQVYLRYI